MDYSTPGFPVLHYLPELLKFLSIESVMPTNRLIFCCPLFLLSSIFPNIFSKELALPIRCPKYWSFSFKISPYNEYSGLISFRIDWFDHLAVQGTLSSLAPQFKSINPLSLSLLYSPTLTSVHDKRKNHNFDYTELCWQSGISAFQYTKFVIAILPRSKHLLISLLQSPSTLILGLQEMKSDIVPWSDMNRCHDLHFVNVEY